MIKGLLDRLFALYAASPLIFIIAIWWFGGSVLAAILGFGTNHRELLWTIGIGAAVLVAIALTHDNGLIRKIWPVDSLPEFRKFIMDLLDKYTNKAVLEQHLSAKVKSEQFDAEACVNALKEKIIGQDAIIEEIAESLMVRLAKVSRSKPIMVAMMAGPPGSGKTELAKQLAKYLNRGFLTFDMANCSTVDGVSTLFGAGKIYQGADTYGTLTGGLRDQPRCVVLLDEIEKALPEVHTRFLQAWDQGFIAEMSNGHKVPTNQAIFLMTTNAAWEKIEEASKGAADADALKRATTSILKEAKFAPEVISRIDEVFVFRRVEGMNAARLAVIQLVKLIDEEFGVELVHIDPSILSTMVERAEALQEAGGVRAIIRVLEKALGRKLIYARDQQKAKKVRLEMAGDKIEDAQVIPVFD